MKVLFLISSINSRSSGLGGHYHSLLNTAEAVSLHNEVVIVNIGTEPAKALQTTNLKVYFIIKKNIAFLKILKELKDIIKLERPHIIHSFDRIVFFWGRLISRQYKLTNVLTKCGGPNMNYHPFCENIILYSQENYHFFKNSRKFKDSNIKVIPNRVKKFSNDENRIKEIKSEINLNGNSFIFLRINRIGEVYKHSSIQLINLVNQLNKDGLSCYAIIIGTVQDYKVLENLKAISTNQIYYFNEDHFAKNAKEVIDISDAVLGTGRSLMEAASKSKILLCPSKSTFPVLLNNETFSEAFDGNFSERVNFNSVDDKNNYSKIKELVTSPNLREESTSFSREMFDKYFNIKSVPNQLKPIYCSTKKNFSFRPIDFILHFSLVFRSFLIKK